MGITAIFDMYFTLFLAISLGLTGFVIFLLYRLVGAAERMMEKTQKARQSN